METKELVELKKMINDELIKIENGEISAIKMVSDNHLNQVLIYKKIIKYFEYKNDHIKKCNICITDLTLVDILNNLYSNLKRGDDYHIILSSELESLIDKI